MDTTTRTIDWTAELAEQLEWHWQHQLRPRLDGLTDEEYRWEPVEGCWSVRPRAAATTSMAAGAGEIVADYEHPEPEPAPFTTIAWRMGHVSVGVLGARNHSHFGGPPCDYPTTRWPIDAAGGLAMLDDAYARWVAGVRSLDADALARPCGPAEGPYAQHSMAALVLHIHREVIHHGAELCMLRDLYRASRGVGVSR